MSNFTSTGKGHFVGVSVGVIFILAFGALFGNMRLLRKIESLAAKNSLREKRFSVAERVGDILAKKPGLKSVAASSGGKLEIRIFKHERVLELDAPGWTEPRIYPVTAFSGELGPKLREGDGQIPEGIYGIEYLNPNSKFYLSLKVSYPNSADKARAKKDGRTMLGGDIMIHGKNVTVGCVPIGDEAIEEVFYLVNAVGKENVRVILAPYDMRKGRRPELETSGLSWYSSLCDELETALEQVGAQ